VPDWQNSENNLKSEEDAFQGLHRFRELCTLLPCLLAKPLLNCFSSRPVWARCTNCGYDPDIELIAPHTYWFVREESRGDGELGSKGVRTSWMESRGGEVQGRGAGGRWGDDQAQIRNWLALFPLPPLLCPPCPCQVQLILSIKFCNNSCSL